ncbi:hypothetical protein Tco_0599531 [Tanacetum coccineum]
MMPSARSQSTSNGSKPKPRINNQKSRNWPASKSSCVTTKTVPIAEHSGNFRNFSNFKHFVCSTCQKCVVNANHDHFVTKFLNEVNSCAKVPSNETTNRNKTVEQRSFAKKPERQIPKGHRWVPTGKIFTSSTTKVDSEPQMVLMKIALTNMNANKLLMSVQMNENKGIMSTKIELTLEQSQQGVSNDVLLSIEGVEE